MKYEQPIEDFDQYISDDGIAYVSSKISEDLQPWFEEMIDRYGLEVLIRMFPYVTLIVDEDTGMLKPWTSCKYNARVTNAFHIRYAKEKIHQNEQEQYMLNLEKHYPKQDTSPIRNISIDSTKLVAGEHEMYSPDYENMPEEIKLEQMPKNWHPNRDSKGNYLSSKPQVLPYRYTTVPCYNNSYLPSYRTFTSYPIR